jgi:hypothetical protein
MPELSGSQFIKDAGTSLLIFRPGEPTPIGNIFATWSSLVAAAQLLVGHKIIYIDTTLGAATIPAGAWDFLTPTEFRGSPATQNKPGTVLTIADGATLANVFVFRDVGIDSQSTTFIIDVPDINTRYQFFGTANVIQTGAAGAFIRHNRANRVVEIDLYETSAFRANAGAIVLNMTIAASILLMSVFDGGSLGVSTLAGVAAVATQLAITSPAASASQIQAGLPGGVFTAVNRLSVSPQIAYTPAVLADWNGVAPTDLANALDRIAAKITPIP